MLRCVIGGIFRLFVKGTIILYGRIYSVRLYCYA